MSGRDLEAEARERVEKEAREQGWTPKDEWQGDPARWKDAKQFVEDGEKINSALKGRIDRQQAQIDSLLATNKQHHEFMQQSVDREKREKEAAIKELEKVREQAVTDGDGKAFTDADRQISELRQPEPQQNGSGLSPESSRWVGQNQWYGKDREMTDFADSFSDVLANKGYVRESEAYFDALTDEVEKRFPDEFGNKNRHRPSSVETGGNRKTDSGKKTFDDLPKEAKDAYARFEKDIPGFTKEEYVENYDWEGEI